MSSWWVRSRVARAVRRRLAIVRPIVLGFLVAARRRGSARLVRVASGDVGMSTAEYAVGTIAAVAFAAVLYKVVSSTTVVQALTGLISRALSAPF